MSAQPAGVPDLPPEQLEQWSNDLVSFLTSDKVPSSFRPWARAQADAVDAYMASADDLEGPAAVEPAEAVAPTAPSAPAPLRKRTLAAQPEAAPAKSGTVVFEMPANTAKLILGVLAALLVLGVVYGIVALTRDNGSSSIPASAASQSTGATTVPFDTVRAADLMKTATTDPSNTAALQELGDMNLNSQKYADAITWYTKLAALNPSDKATLDNIAVANLYLGNDEQAKTWAQKALAIDPNDLDGHYYMGYVYASASPPDLVSAVKEWDTVVAIGPTSQEGQTAKTHSAGLRAQMTSTAAAGGGSASTSVPPASKAGTPVPTGTP